MISFTSLENTFVPYAIVIIIIIIIFLYIFKEIYFKFIKKEKSERDLIENKSFSIIRRSIIDYSFAIIDSDNKILFISKNYKSFIGMKKKIIEFKKDLSELKFEIHETFLDSKLVVAYDKENNFLGVSRFTSQPESVIEDIKSSVSFKIKPKMIKLDDYERIEYPKKIKKKYEIDLETEFDGRYYATVKYNHELIVKSLDFINKSDYKKIEKSINDSIENGNLYTTCIDGNYKFYIYDQDLNLIAYSRFYNSKEELIEYVVNMLEK